MHVSNITFLFKIMCSSFSLESYSVGFCSITLLYSSFSFEPYSVGFVLSLITNHPPLHPPLLHILCPFPVCPLYFPFISGLYFLFSRSTFYSVLFTLRRSFVTSFLSSFAKFICHSSNHPRSDHVCVCSGHDPFSMTTVQTFQTRTLIEQINSLVQSLPLRSALGSSSIRSIDQSCSSVEVARPRKEMTFC